MCEHAQEHIKTLWQSRITGNAIKAAVCTPFNWADLGPACLHIKRISAVFYLQLLVVCQRYAVRQVSGDQFRTATKLNVRAEEMA